MLISHRKQFIYTKTAKTGGTSVESYFEKYCMPEGEWEFSHAREEYISEAGIIGYRGVDHKEKKWWNHMPASEIRDNIGQSLWNKYYKFCVVRNPFDKLISGFYFFENKKRETKELINSFRNWIKSGKPLTDRDRYMIDGEICMDYFIRHENMEEGINYVCSVMNIPFEKERIPKLKSGYRNFDIPIQNLYDEETIQIVKQRFSFELEYFGYNIPWIPGK